MENNKIIGILVMFALIIALGFTIVFAGRNKTITGAVSAGSSSMSSEGFSSNEEMMAAHHPNQAQKSSDSTGSCGGVAENSNGVSQKFAGEKSAYGITYDNAGYEQLLDAAKNVKLSSEQTKLIVGFDVQMPCCEFKMLQASGNCECGHHVALYGLSKLLVSQGYAHEQIQSEINKWKLVFYPAGSSSSAGGC